MSLSDIIGELETRCKGTKAFGKKNGTFCNERMHPDESVTNYYARVKACAANAGFDSAELED